jgi:hypothetical protein
MDKVLSLVTSDPGDRRKYGGDSSTDQLNCVHTFYILTAFAIIMQAGHIIGTPIACWSPAHFTDTHADYTNTVWHL